MASARGARILAALLTPMLLGADRSSAFDHYVLALNWQPAFCQFNMDKPECRELDGTDFAATHLAIHGLWPDTAESRRLDEPVLRLLETLRPQFDLLKAVRFAHAD